MVLCLLRNGRPYIESFVEHYLSHGAKHLVFLDNGSTDGTVEALREHDNVTVLRSSLPYQRYQVLMKRYLIERFGRGRWSLYVDIDELFDYPYSDAVDLRSLLGYLNEHGYTAVVSYMLDMFPGEPLSQVSENGDRSLRESHCFYESRDVRAWSYREAEGTGNVVSNEDIDILRGGVQRRVFNISPMLTKHPLIFLDDEIEPMDSSDHWAGNARVADFTSVLFHYKLTGNLYGSVRREMEEGRYVNRHGKYGKYSRVLEENPSLEIKGEHSRELRSVNDLLGTPFAAVSREYMGFALGDEQKGPFEPFIRAQAEVRTQARRVEEAKQEIKHLKQRLRRNERHQEKLLQQARSNNGQLREQNRRLERQLQGIRSSRSWRILDRINRLKNRVLGKA